MKKLNSRTKNIIIAACLVLLVGFVGIAAVAQSVRTKKNSQSLTDTLPLGETPEPSTYPLSSATPLPLITFPNLGETPKPSTTPKVNASQCEYLQADPTSGVAPLEVKLSASGIAVIGSNREYEFDFGDGVSVKQATTSVTHTYKGAKVYTASLRVRDNEGKLVNLGFTDCQRTITVRNSSDVKTLPKTGPSTIVLALLAPITLVGVYLIKRFRLV